MPSIVSLPWKLDVEELAVGFFIRHRLDADAPT